MGNVSDKLRYLLDTKNAIKQSIRQRGVQVTENDTFRSYADKILEIGDSTQLPIDESQDVIFYDLDGSTWASYSKEEFANLEQLPAAPQRDGLISQGWNRSLIEMKTYVLRDGFCTAEPLFITESGHTELVVDIVAGRQKYPIYITTDTVGSVVIDWGDGSDDEHFPDLSAINTYHIFRNPGVYKISIKSLSGSIKIGSGSSELPEYFNSAYRNMLKEVHAGSNLNEISKYAFYNHKGLEIVALSNRISSIGVRAFSQCQSLKIVSISDALESLGSYAFAGCWELIAIKYPSISSIPTYAFCKCFSLKCINMPNTISVIGEWAFTCCESLRSIGYPSTLSTINTGTFAYSGLRDFIGPRSLITIQTVAFYNSALEYVELNSESGLTINTNAFATCGNLKEFVNRATSMNAYAILYNCQDLRRVKGPVGSSSSSYSVSGSRLRDTNLSFSTSYSSTTRGACDCNYALSIVEDGACDGGYQYNNCPSLIGITLASTVTSLSNSNTTLAGCSSFKYLDLSKCDRVVPLSSTALFNNVPADYIIIVPKDRLEAYKSATNWASIASHIVSDFQVDECTSLEIEAQDVSATKTSTKISYRAIVNGFDPLSGAPVTGYVLTGTATSEEFPENESADGPVVREISFTYMGITATTTILQGARVPTVGTYTVSTSQWRMSSTVQNPDSSLYDGVWESNSNYNVNSGIAKMTININGYTNFKLLIRSDAESTYDYVRVGELDKEPSKAMYASTKGNQNPSTAISAYTEVQFTEIDGLNHNIYIEFYKDQSINSGADRGYVLIPINQE